MSTSPGRAALGNGRLAATLGACAHRAPAAPAESFWQKIRNHLPGGSKKVAPSRPSEDERLPQRAPELAKHARQGFGRRGEKIPGMEITTLRSVLLAALALVASVSTSSAAPAKKSKPAAPSAAKPLTIVVQPRLDPKAIDILKAASARLAAARTLRFTAVVTYENPSLLGPPLAYTTTSEVTVQRPDKLRVITSGDGPPSEFYYDGKVMMALAPVENLVAVASAPSTIDGALKAAYDSAAIYFPFSDVIVANPYGDIAGGLKHAYYIGQSNIVGGTSTDMIAYLDDAVFVQAWIGAEDKLPRRLRAVYLNDPVRLRHQLDLSNWQLDLDLPADVFGSAKAAAATHINFARPDPQLPPGLSPPPRRSAAKKAAPR